MLNDFTPSGVAHDVQPRVNIKPLTQVIDHINQAGMGNIWFAGRCIAPAWQIKLEMLSSAYTTRWSDIPFARL
ncbi:DUF4113 domain-containing protein [Pantoea agglomerans]|uniref:DUF4113 domain-containing protein n=1 Tax=Enterobacter agglomerans TaxID=549 RepID=UPI003207F179